MDYQMVTWPIPSRDPRRCCEAVRSAILATAWLLVSFIHLYLLKNVDITQQKAKEQSWTKRSLTMTSAYKQHTNNKINDT